MEASPLLDSHERAGARLGGRPEAPALAAPVTFGDVPAEWRAATQGAALLDATDRGRVRVRGGEAAAFLHRLLANDVHVLQPGHGNRNLLLSPKGKVRFDFDLARDAEGFVLSTQPGRAESRRCGPRSSRPAPARSGSSRATSRASSAAAA